MTRSSDASDGARLRLSVPADGCEPARLWHVLATPSQWHRWAPHIRGVTGAPDDDRLRTGARLRIHGYGPVHVTAVITRVEAPRRWDFRVDLPLGHHLTSVHEVLVTPRTVRVRMFVTGPLPDAVTTPLLRAYRPVARLALRRLVALARRPG